MKKFQYVITRQITEQASIEIEAATIEEAHAKMREAQLTADWGTLTSKINHEVVVDDGYLVPVKFSTF